MPSPRRPALEQSCPTFPDPSQPFAHLCRLAGSFSPLLGHNLLSVSFFVQVMPVERCRDQNRLGLGRGGSAHSEVVYILTLGTEMRYRRQVSKVFHVFRMVQKANLFREDQTRKYSLERGRRGILPILRC